VSKSRALEVVNRVSQIANLEGDREDRLRQVAMTVVDGGYADVCGIYLREGAWLLLKAAAGVDPDRLDPRLECAESSCSQSDAAGKIRVCQCQAGKLLAQHTPLPLAEGLHGLYGAAFPLRDGRPCCVGTIALWRRRQRPLTASEYTLFNTLAAQILGILNTAQLSDQVRRKFQEQTKMAEVDRALSSTLNLDELLDLIAKISVELTNARGCVLCLLNQEQTLLEIKSCAGKVVVAPLSKGFRVGEGVAGRVAERGMPMRVDDMTLELPETSIITSLRHSLICVPIVGKEGVIGTIMAFDKHPEGNMHQFAEEDITLLMSFAGHAAIAIEHARFYERMEELALDNLLRLRELSILYHINTAMRSTVKLNKLMRIILAGVTIGGGLGFNRAVLLMVNERAQTLKGLLAVGPGSGQEAYEIWQNTEVEQRSLVEMMIDVPDEDEYEETSFEKTAKSIWLPLTPEHGILARTVLEKRAFNVTEESAFFSESHYVVELLDSSRFAAVPLVVRDKVIGVIYVDNRYNNVPIRDDDMNFLQMFANQAALAIDNAMLYSNLERRNLELRSAQGQLVEMEKMTALGKMSATIAHEIRNPLICVGGFAKRLLKDETLSEKSRKYVNIIEEEAARLEKILQDILQFSREERMQFEECQINTVIKHTLDVLMPEIADRKVEVNTFFYTELNEIRADTPQLKQVFMNLLTNALHQVPSERGLINIMTSNAISFAGGVSIEISDNGGGIPPEVIDNIFNPFFTTKGTGTGLGLAITRKIIDSHHGTIHVRNRPGVGVAFIINLPFDPAISSEEDKGKERV